MSNYITMSKIVADDKTITEDDMPLGYSSEPDEYESEHVHDLQLAAEPFEIYVGNTGKVDFEEFFTLFKSHGFIKDMTFWRTHDHLYHCRIAYRSKDNSDRAIKQRNNRMAFSKRIRVSYVNDRVDLDFSAAVRIDDISADVTEEDIFDHFLPCGAIRFVIKTGYAAYIQFFNPSSVAEALELDMILNGDPYTLSTISGFQELDHIQVIENMKDIKYRKPFVIVENYPELLKGTPLCRYKSNFESVGPVRYFKVAPTANGTVTLALCMDKADDRDSVIDRFNDTIISGKRLKLYMASGVARMTVAHLTKYVICNNSITVDTIRPYYKEYDVCVLFEKCGSISFLERIGNRWLVCFDNPSAVTLARNYYVFSLHKRQLEVKELDLAGKNAIMAEAATYTNPPGHLIFPAKLPSGPISEKKMPNKPKPVPDEDYVKQVVGKMDENKQTMKQIAKVSPLDGATKQQTLANQSEQSDEELFKTRTSLTDEKVTPVAQSKQKTLPLTKEERKQRLAPFRWPAPQDSTNDQKPIVEEKKMPDILKPGPIEDCIKQLARKIDEYKQILEQKNKVAPLDGATEQQPLANQTEQSGELFKTRESLTSVKVTSVAQPKASTSQPNKRPANDNGTDAPPARDSQDSTNDPNAIVEGWRPYPHFPYGVLQEEILMKQPPGYSNGDPDTVCSLKRSLYGLKQAARVWNQRIDAVLKDMGFHRSSADPCLYLRIVDDLNDYCYRFLVTISNLPKGIEENDLRELFPKFEMSVSLFGSKDLYHPTSFAYVRLPSRNATRTLIRQHHDLYRGKRFCIQHIQRCGWQFMPEKSIMLKNLPKDMTEEGITEELEKISKLKVMDVIKPAHHYAYVDFIGNVEVDEKLLSSLRTALMGFKIYVFPLYKKLPKRWMGIRSYEIRPIEKMRGMYGAKIKEDAKNDDKEFGAHNGHKLFVGNIFRDTEDEDVIDYFNNFGSVIDYTPIEKRSSFLRKSAILSFMNSRHAQNAFCQQSHFLEGSLLDVHLMDSPPVQYTSDMPSMLFTVKFLSRFLTNDEIRYGLHTLVNVNHHIRFDAFDDRANYVANYRPTKRPEGTLDSIFNTQYINDEAVKIVPGYDPTPPTCDEVQEKKDISNSPHRRRKLNYLKMAGKKENLKETMKLRSRPNTEADIPFKSFFNDNSVQINNVSLDTTPEDIRDLFIKCGDIVDYRALILEEDATKVCYVKFKIALAANLACKYSQRMVNGKRVLVHLARETLLEERDRSILVDRLNPSTTAEQVHAAFNKIGMVKYVQKQSLFSAIVCFKDCMANCMVEAVNVKTIPNSRSFTVNPCYEEYNPRFFDNFSCQEESIPIERIQAALKPRPLPEFHQLELDRKVFETLPGDIKTRLINEVSLAREQLPNFNILSKQQQIEALKTQYQDFTQKEHFLRLTAREQEKLLDVTSNLQQEKVKDLEVLPPAPKQTRKEEPVSKKPKKVLGPLRKIEPLVTTVHAGHAAQVLPPTCLHRFPRNNRPPRPMGPRSGHMFPRGPRFPNMYRQQGPPRFGPRMPPFGGPNQYPMMRPRPRPMMMRQPMEMAPPMEMMGGMPHMRGMSHMVGGMPPAGGGPPDHRSMQQQIAAMAYNAEPVPQGAMDFDGCNSQSYFY